RLRPDRRRESRCAALSRPARARPRHRSTRGRRRQRLRQQDQPPSRTRSRHHSRHPAQGEREGRARLLRQSALPGACPHRADRRQAQTLQAHRPTLREDKAKLCFLRRARRRLLLGQIRPHGLATGVPKNHPLVRFARKPDNVEVALELDDTVVWGALTQMSEAKTSIIANLATRLRDRKLYKCIDIRAQVSHALNPKYRTDDEIIERIDRCCAEINRVLAETELSDQNGLPRLL